MHVFWESLGEMHTCHFGVTLHAWCYDGCLYLHVAIRTLRSSYSYHYNEVTIISRNGTFRQPFETLIYGTEQHV